MSAFKPGDEVRVSNVREVCLPLQKHERAALTIDRESEAMEDWYWLDGGVEGSHPASEFELVEPVVEAGSFVMYTDELLKTGTVPQHPAPEEVGRVDGDRVHYASGGYDLRSSLRLATDEELAAAASKATEAVLDEAHEQVSQYAADEAQRADDGWWEVKLDSDVALVSEGGTNTYLDYEQAAALGLELRVQLRRRPA